MLSQCTNVTVVFQDTDTISVKIPVFDVDVNDQSSLSAALYPPITDSSDIFQSERWNGTTVTLTLKPGAKSIEDGLLLVEVSDSSRDIGECFIRYTIYRSPVLPPNGLLERVYSNPLNCTPTPPQSQIATSFGVFVHGSYSTVADYDPSLSAASGCVLYSYGAKTREVAGLSTITSDGIYQSITSPPTSGLLRVDKFTFKKVSRPTLVSDIVRCDDKNLPQIQSSSNGSTFGAEVVHDVYLFPLYQCVSVGDLEFEWDIPGSIRSFSNRVYVSLDRSGLVKLDYIECVEAPGRDGFEGSTIDPRNKDVKVDPRFVLLNISNACADQSQPWSNIAASAGISVTSFSIL
jgi:hypothetical protein